MLPLRQYLESLPRKRMGAGCLLYNEQDQILLVKPGYKATWEIPGGVVELNESPLACCLRELREELGLDRPVGRLLVLDYNHAAGDYTESLMFIFDGGVLRAAEIEAIRLQSNELTGFDFFAPHVLPDNLSPRLRRRILAAWQNLRQPGDVYTQDLPDQGTYPEE